VVGTTVENKEGHMALNWNIGKIKGWKATGKKTVSCDDLRHDGKCEVCPKIEERLVHHADGTPIPWVVTARLIDLTMFVLLGEITEKNAEEFAIRLSVVQEVYGAFIHNDKGDRIITTAEVFDHIGLSTNVSNKTRGQFMTTIKESLERRETESVKREIEEMKKVETAKEVA
jgi:hypothetical protein